MEDQSDQEHTTFYDEADHKFEVSLAKRVKLAKGITEDDEARSDAKESLDADRQVRETEDASLQDDSYAFDESNTDNEEYHDVSDATDYDFEKEDDLHP